MSQTISKIYLHWSATGYNWAVPGHYHTIVQGNGSIRRMAGYDQLINGHTFARNTNAVGICLACMGGQGWQDFPPTSAQIDSLCQEVANLALQLGWQPDDITLQRVMTHAEAAANRDYTLDLARLVSDWRSPTSTPQANEYTQRARAFGLPHENYGPSRWFDGWPGGFVDRWDLWQLRPSDPPGEAGFTLRETIKRYMRQQPSSAVILPTPTSGQSSSTTSGQSSPTTSGQSPTCDIFMGSRLLAKGVILSDRRCYVRLAVLAQAYRIGLTWNNTYRYANLKTQQLTAKYLADSPLVPGYPAVEVYLNRPEDSQGNPISDPRFPTQPMMAGVMINGSVHVVVTEFCQELGIAVRVPSAFVLELGEIPASSGSLAPTIVTMPPPITAPPPTVPSSPPTTTPSPTVPLSIPGSTGNNILRTVDIFLGESRLISKGYLMADRRTYVKIANLVSSFGMRLLWNNAQRYVNLITNRFQAKYLVDTPLIANYPVMPVFLNRPEDSQGRAIDNPQNPVQPFLQGIILESSLFVILSDFCQELGITIRVDPDFSIHLGDTTSGTSPAPVPSISVTTPLPIVTPPPISPPPVTPSPQLPIEITPQPPTPTAPPLPDVRLGSNSQDFTQYTVEAGDTLARITRTFLGANADWRTIANFNNISDPSQLRVGQTLRIPLSLGNPQPSTPSPTFPDPQPPAPTNPQPPVTPQPPTTRPPIANATAEYVVQAGDTLAKIAQTLLGAAGEWRTIAQLNGITDPAQLKVGQRLRLPQSQFQVPALLADAVGNVLESVTFAIEGKTVIAHRLTSQQRDRVGTLYQKGLYRPGNHPPETFLANSRDLLRTLQLSDSEINAMIGTAENEGALDAINTWDDSFLSFGMFQWTAGQTNYPGELGALLLLLKQRQPATFQRYFGQFGLDIQRENNTTGWILLSGQRLGTASQKEVLRQHIWAYRFALAGADPLVQSVQMLHAINRLDTFYFQPQRSLGNQPLSSLITSEYGVALLLDNHVNRPAYVAPSIAEALKQLNLSPAQLAQGTDADERRALERYLTVRRTYGGSFAMTDADKRAQRTRASVTAGKLSDRRGSFRSNRQIRQ